MRVTAKTFLGTGEEIRAAATSFHFPHAIETLAVVRDYIDMSRRRRDYGWAHADMQLHLVMSLQVELRALQQLRAVNISNDDEARRQLNFMQQATKATINALTQVADGIAFRFLDYDLGLCQAFLANQTSPFAVLQEGFVNVLDVASSTLDAAGGQVLICDLNSITNEGDFIHRNEKGLEVIEVKRGKNRRGSRLARQTERLTQLSEFLNHRRGVLDGKACEILTVPNRTHYTADLKSALDEATERGVSVRQLTDYHSVMCVDAGVLDSTALDDAFRWGLDETKKLWPRGRVGEVSSLMARQWAGNVVPMTVLPLTSLTVAELLMGQKMFISSINIDALFSKMAELGWDVLDLSETDMDAQPFAAPALAFLTDVENPLKTNTLPVDFVRSCAANFVTIESMMAPAKQIAREREDRFHWIPSYGSEASLWD